MMPVRIQRKRTRGWKMPPNTVYVGRGSKWGNPFTIAEYGRERAVANHALLMREFYDSPSTLGIDFRDALEGLAGKNLACWCKPGEACHADVLLELANRDEVKP